MHTDIRPGAITDTRPGAITDTDTRVTKVVLVDLAADMMWVIDHRRQWLMLLQAQAVRTPTGLRRPQLRELRSAYRRPVPDHQLRSAVLPAQQLPERAGQLQAP